MPTQELRHKHKEIIASIMLFGFWCPKLQASNAPQKIKKI